jgi:hypothetical protein
VAIDRMLLRMRTTTIWVSCEFKLKWPLVFLLLNGVCYRVISWLVWQRIQSWSQHEQFCTTLLRTRTGMMALMRIATMETSQRQPCIFSLWTSCPWGGGIFQQLRNLIQFLEVRERKMQSCGMLLKMDIVVPLTMWSIIVKNYMKWMIH